MTKLPLAVHLMATSWICGGVTAAKSWLRFQQRDSSESWPSLLMPRLARSTNRLGLGGLALVAAKKVRVGGWMGAGALSLLLLVLASLQEGGDGGAFLRASTALDSCWRESWIFYRSRLGEVLIRG